MLGEQRIGHVHGEGETLSVGGDQGFFPNKQISALVIEIVEQELHRLDLPPICQKLHVFPVGSWNHIGGYR
jgi:hypothetical protein